MKLQKMKSITTISELDPSKKYTYADYLTWHFKDRMEIIKGFLFKISPAPKRNHQKISVIVTNLFFNTLNHKTCEIYEAPFDVRLTKNKGVPNEEIDTVVQPDICIICDLEKLDDYGCIGAPDLIVEILSKSTSKKDEINKFQLYEENGVKEYWMIYPDTKVVKVFVLKNNKYEVVDYYQNQGNKIPVNIFEGISFDYDTIFEGIG